MLNQHAFVKRVLCLCLSVCAAKAMAQPGPPAQKEAQVEIPGQDPLAAIEEKYVDLLSFAQGLFYLQTMYVDEDKVKSEVVIQNALEGIVAHLDPHTIVMPKKAFEQLTSDTRGKFGGVGIIVSQEQGKLVIISPIEDSPAMKAGIKAGDEIIAINGTTISQLKGAEATDLMRGQPGSTLTLTIRRKTEKEPREFSLVREIIKVHSVRGEALADGIYYARIASFQENTTDELNKFLSERQANLKGFILDLRDNPGGLLDQAVKVADLFIESGLILSTVGRDHDRIEREFAHKEGTYSGFPMVVLVNDGSASASEIVAGALQDHQRALLLGTTTFGKGSVQTLVSLPNGSGLKLTVARYYTPNDRSIQAKGIVPDIYVARQEDSSGNSKQRHEADLSGHISGQDLSNFSQNNGVFSLIKKWPSPYQSDRQLVSAFTYIKGWTIFQRKGS